MPRLKKIELLEDAYLTSDGDLLKDSQQSIVGKLNEVISTLNRLT